MTGRTTGVYAPAGRPGPGERPSRGRGTGVPHGTPARVRDVSGTGRTLLLPVRLQVAGREREVALKPEQFNHLVEVAAGGLGIDGGDRPAP